MYFHKLIVNKMSNIRTKKAFSCQVHLALFTLLFTICCFFTISLPQQDLLEQGECLKIFPLLHSEKFSHPYISC